MCACEPGYTCQRCRDTPHDTRYHDDDPRDDAQRARDAWIEGMSDTYAD